MKKTFVLLAAVSLCVTACGDDGEQEPNPGPGEKYVLEPSVKEYEAEAGGGEFTFTVTANTAFETVIPDAAPWLSLTGTRPAGGGQETTLAFRAEKNTAGDPRSAQVKLVAAEAGLERTVLVTQKFIRVVEVGEDSYTAAAEGETFAVAVTVNTEYDVVIPEDAPWLTLAETRSELHDETLTFTASRNADGRERSAEVSIGAPSGPERRLVVTQPSVEIPQAEVVWMDGEGADPSMCLVKAVSTRPIDGTEAEDLSASGTANCYVVRASAGDRTYRFDANVMGNGAQGVAAMNNGNQVSGSLQLGGGVSVAGDGSISDELAGSFVYFTVTGGRQGNAVVTVYGTDREAGALWTWHVWVVDGSNDPTDASNLQTYKFTADNMPAASTASKWILTPERWTGIGDVQAMDRNLGAETDDPGAGSADFLRTAGLSYCWGFNVPFPGALRSVSNSEQLTGVWSLAQGAEQAEPVTSRYKVENGVCHSMDLKEAIANPGRGCSLVGEAYYNLWGQRVPLDYVNYYDDSRNPGYISLDYTHKSIFDPCPPGYCLPPQYLFFGFQTLYTKYNNGKTATANAANIETMKDDKGVWFYIAGRGSGETAWYPLTGYYGSGTGAYNSVGSYGSQWTSAPDYGSVTYGANFYFSPSVCCPPTNNARYFGYSVRCVKEL